jgi:hypothetical protein
LGLLVKVENVVQKDEGIDAFHVANPWFMLRDTLIENIQPTTAAPKLQGPSKTVVFDAMANTGVHVNSG